jgi:hypothetical protein
VSKERQKRVQQDRDIINREASAAKQAAGLRYLSSGRGADESALRLMEMIPPDTRDLTARLFGDPLPGRSALDAYVEKRKAQGRHLRAAR